MRYLIYCFLLFPCLFITAQDLPVYENPSLKDPKDIISSQIKSLDNLTQLTQETLNTLSHLRKEIVNYETIQNLYLDHPNDKELLYKMTKMAFHLQEEIKEKNLTQVFDLEFLSELALLAKIYQKHELPKL